MAVGRIDNQWTGIGLYLVCVIAMAANGAIVKLIGGDVPLQQILLFRFGFSLLPLLVVGIGNRRALTLRSHRYTDHMVRSVSGVCSIGLYFVAILFIPLASATALAYSAPIFCVALAVPLLGEIIGIRRIVAVSAGFVGVSMIALSNGDWSTSSLLSIGSLAGIGSGLCGGLVLTYLRKLSDTESALTSSLIYNGFGTLVFALWCLLSGWNPLSGSQWNWLLLLGTLAGIQQLALANAFRFAEASLLAPMEYLVLVFAAVAGFLVWGEMPGLLTWLGAAIIIAAGLFMLQNQRRRLGADSRLHGKRDAATIKPG